VPEAEPHITEYLVETYGTLAAALGDIAVGSDESPSRKWGIEVQKPRLLYQRALREFAEKAAVQAEAAAIAHLRLLARAYWPNLANPNPEDQEDWQSEAVYPVGATNSDTASGLGRRMPRVSGRCSRVERVQRILV